MKEDREEQGSWEEKVANSIELFAFECCEFDCVSAGEFESIWRLTGFLVWCVRGLGSIGVLFFWIAPVAFTTRGRVSRSTLPASLFEHPSMSQPFNPPTQRDHTAL